MQAERIPKALNTTEFNKWWNLYQDHLKEQFRPMGTIQQGALLMRLASWGEPEAVRAIQNTIENGWKGIRRPEPGASPARLTADF